MASLVSRYLESIDGIGQEDLYYGYHEDGQPTPGQVNAELERHLDLFRAAAKLVLTVDYVTLPEHVGLSYRKSRDRGFVPLATVRALDQLTVNLGYEPD